MKVIKIKKLFLIILLLIPVYISSFYFKKAVFLNSKDETKKNDNPVIVHIQDKDLYLDLEDYVLGVVASEMPALFNDEALKAQAVAARSFAMSRAHNNVINISSSISDQVYQQNFELSNKWNDNYYEYYKKIEKAVIDTKGMVIKRDNIILPTYYFSMSNGKTENSENVFKENLFVSVDSSYDKNVKNFKYVKTISEREMLNLLNVDNILIGDIKKNNTNHVESIIISDKIFTGIEFRKLLGLRSTDFEIKRVDNNYEITTYGYGHGVGMSQYGANEMAKNGADYKEILNHYYQNTILSKI